MPAARQRAAGRGQPGRGQEAGRAAEVARARAVRGHLKSRHYSTTLGALRQARADYRAAQDAGALGLDDRDPDTVLVLTDWQYAGHGHTPGEAALAATIARGLRTNRETAREALLSEGSAE